jgi:hypothetical protein
VISYEILVPILKPYGLKPEDGKVVSATEIYGSVSMDVVYELMFLHGYTRHDALVKISALLNEPTIKPKKKKRPAKKQDDRKMSD